MRAEEIDLDRIVDYRSEYTAVIKKPKITGDQMIGLCPFHQDKNDSFSVDLKTGKWHCFSEDRGGNFISFWAELNGVSTQDAYKQILAKYGVQQQDRKKTEAERKSYSLQQYAFEKKLPKEWLEEKCHLSTEKDRYSGATYLLTPYYDETGKETTHRKRFANKDFRWKARSSGKIGLYGEWRLPEIRTGKSVILVEGESDTQSLWYMDLPALGVPGASMFKTQHASLLQDLTIYIHQEADTGGKTFFRKVTESLRDGGFIGTVKRFTCSAVSGCKDPSDILIKFGKEDGTQKILSLIKKAETIDLDQIKEIPEAIKGAPVNLECPEGWAYSEKGIFLIGKNYSETLICRTPIILTQRLKSLDTGEEKIEIAFLRDGGWQRAIFQRSTIFTARGITQLADLGCTVTSENAKPLVGFLQALEAKNIELIAKADATATFGWQKGNRFVPGLDDGIVLDIDANQRPMAEAYMQQGTLEGWTKLMEPHRIRDKFRFILAAGFAAPLLRIIKQRIFFVYNWGGSKGGKTAALKAALSTWGDPDRLMINFNATQVGLERTASFFCDLPLGIDERQLAGRNQDSLERIVYMIASGTGKIRGSKNGGIQATRQWRTVALATGEEPISKETSQTGVSTRVLEVYGGPFDNEVEASLMHQRCADDCGNAGPAFIEKLVQMNEDTIREAYQEMTDFVSAISNGRSGSHIAGVAAVALADAMADSWLFTKSDQNGTEIVQNGTKNAQNVQKTHEKLEISTASWIRAQAMAAAILKEQMAADTGDVNENALQFVTDWVLSNQSFFGADSIGTCFGTMSESGNIAYIFPAILTQALERAGFSYRKTIRYMAERGLITTREKSRDGGKEYSIFKKFNGRSCRMIEFMIGNIAEAGDPLEVEDDAEAAAPPAPQWEQMSMATDPAFGFVPLEGSEEELPFD